VNNEHINLQKQRRGLNRIVHAFGYSLQGLKAGMQEPAFKQEAYFCIVMIPLAFFIGQTWVEIALLAGSVMIVMIVELLNTDWSLPLIASGRSGMTCLSAAKILVAQRFYSVSF